MDADDPLRGDRADASAGGDRSGEGDVPDQVAGGEPGAGRVTGPEDDVAHPGRHARPDHELRREQGRQRGELRRLDHDRVAGRQARGHTAGQLAEGRIPRRDVGDDAVGFTHRVGERARRLRDGLSADLVGHPRVVLEVPHAHGDIGAGLGQWLARVDGFQPGQHLGVVAEGRRRRGTGAARVRPAPPATSYARPGERPRRPRRPCRRESPRIWRRQRRWPGPRHRRSGRFRGRGSPRRRWPSAAAGVPTSPGIPGRPAHLWRPFSLLVPSGRTVRGV